MKRTIERKKDGSKMATSIKEGHVETPSGVDSKTVMELLNRPTEMEDP